MTRRINKKLEYFLKKQKLTFREYKFLQGCLSFQNKLPQLTNKQWQVVKSIQEKYKNGQEDTEGSQKSK